MVWLGATIEDDSFGRRLLDTGVDGALLSKWMDNPIVNTPAGGVRQPACADSPTSSPPHLSDKPSPDVPPPH